MQPVLLKGFYTYYHVILTKTICNRNYYPHFTSEETEAKRDNRTYLIKVLASHRSRIQANTHTLTPTFFSDM